MAEQERKKVLTIIDYTDEQRGVMVKVECPTCNTIPERIGANFCSNCGQGLEWENIMVRTKKIEEPNTPPPMEADAGLGEVTGSNADNPKN